MNGSILVKIQDRRVEIFLNCTYEEQEALELIVSEIRRVVEEALDSVGAEELMTCGVGLAGGSS